MDHLWSPWRYQYVTTAAPPGGCVFCDKIAMDDRQAFILHRAALNYVVLNLYPYADGHVMIVPFEHVDSLAAAPPETAREMMELTRRTESILRSVYRAPGINIGMNIGACAGAGVAGHLHMHVVPRWPADSNFMSVIGETRILIEDLPVSYDRLRAAFAAD